MDRTTARSYVRIAPGFVPDNLKSLVSTGQRLFPALFGDGGIEIGPIPPGTPVGLLSNLAILSEDTDPASTREARRQSVWSWSRRSKYDLATLPSNASDDDARRVFREPGWNR